MNNYYKPSGFGGFSFFPPIIKNLLIINASVFFLQILFEGMTFDGKSAQQIIITYFALMPIESGYFEIWQLITYQFMHGGFSHIFFNMFALWMFGAEIENMWGSKKFVTFYLLCGFGAGLLHLFLSPALTGVAAPTIGASGAVYGVLLAFALSFPDRYIFLYFFIPIKAKYLITFLIVMEFMFVDSGTSGVAHLAHLGGALVGFIFIMFDKSIHVDLKNVVNKLRKNYGSTSHTYREKKVDDAKFYDIVDKNESDEISQAEIDAILDKISQSGYQNLSQNEKKVLFEASKRMK